MSMVKKLLEEIGFFDIWEDDDETPLPQELYESLNQCDSQLHGLIMKENTRQYRSLQLIASENCHSLAVKQCMSSVLANKYSEGSVGKRYYSGCEVIDEIESLACERALKCFNLDRFTWEANVQPYSGSIANMAVYLAYLDPHDRIMGLGLADGGHISHGHRTQQRKVSATSIFFESMPYKINETTGEIDYNDLESKVKIFMPKLIVCGYSSYTFDIHYKRMREICDTVKAVLMVDMSHIAGLVAAELLNSPFEYADVVTTTTHKTLRGPRGAVIFTKRANNCSHRVNLSVFPGLQGGPHNHTIAAIAACFKMASTVEFKNYQQNLRNNAQTLMACLRRQNVPLVSESTVNHMFTIDITKIKNVLNLSSIEVEEFLNKCGIVVNRNCIPGDKNLFLPSGIRIGVSTITSRGMKAVHMNLVCNILTTAINALGMNYNDNKVSEQFFEDMREAVFTLVKKFPFPQDEF